MSAITSMPIGASPTYLAPSYVVFGKASGFVAKIDPSSLNGSNGFRLALVTGDGAGVSVACDGDVNGDGFADTIVGAVALVLQALLIVVDEIEQALKTNVERERERNRSSS